MVVVMLENRSFHRAFGYDDPKRNEYPLLSLFGPSSFSIFIHYNQKYLTKSTYYNEGSLGTKYVSGETSVRNTLDPPHDIPPVTVAIANGKMTGFVKSYH